MKKTKLEKGITLIALIITIVILLILAVVAIGAVQKGGIITHAQNTKLIYQVAQIEEALKLKMQEEKLAIAAGELVVDIEGDFNSYHWWRKNAELLVENFPSISYGNVYCDIEPNKGELIGKKLLWLVTDFINGKGIFELEDIELPNSLGINTSLGQNGEYFDLVDMNTGNAKTLSNKDIFFFDESWNVYYVDGEGNVITSKGIYKVDEIFAGSEYFDPEVSLSPVEKVVYDGIYEGAYAFTNDATYAEKLAIADFCPNKTGIVAFVGGGHASTLFGVVTITDSEGNILEINNNKIENVAILSYNPDGTTIDFSSKVFYVMDSNYNMYKVDSENYTLTDAEGNTVQEENELKMGFVSQLQGPEEVIVPEGYTISWRFDGKDILIIDVPDKEELNMAEDFSNFDYEIYAIKHRLFEDKITQRLILPNKMKRLSSIGKEIDDYIDANIEFTTGAFEECKNLTYIKLPDDMKNIYAEDFKNCTNLREVIMPDNIQQIGENAFKGCTNITLRFKDGVALEGAPWGANSNTITITRK